MRLVILPTHSRATNIIIISTSFRMRPPLGRLMTAAVGIDPKMGGTGLGDLCDMLEDEQ